MTAIPEPQTPAALVDTARMVDGAEAVARFGREHGEAFEVWIEIDVDAVGTRLRILPNHACATAAQFPAYTALLPGGVATWPRFQGW